MITARFENLPDIEANHLQVTCSVTHAARWEADGAALIAAEHQLQHEFADNVCKKYEPKMEPHPYGVIYKIDLYVFTPGELNSILKAVYDSGARGEGMLRCFVR